MNKKVEKTLVAALSAAMGAGLVAPVVQAAESSNINALYKAAYDATIKAQTSKTQKDLTEARAALDAFSKVAKTESETIKNLGRTLSSMLDKVQQPLLVQTIKAIETAQKSAKQADIDVARVLIADMPTVWKRSYSSALDKVQNTAIANVRAAIAKALTSRLQEDLDAAKAAYAELLTIKDATVKAWVESVVKTELDAVVVKKDLAVESVVSNNLKELVVKFNQPVDETSAETAANIAISGGTNAVLGTAVLQDDKMTVIIPLSTQAAQQESVTLTVKDVKDADGVKIAETTKTVKFFDATVPSVTGVTVTGPKTLKVTFSEPITSGSITSTTNFSIDNNTYSVASVAGTAGDNYVTVTLGSTLPAGNHTLVVNATGVNATPALVDYAGFFVPKTTLTFAYAEDKVAPTVELVSAKQNQVKIKFSKPIDAATQTYLSVYHTYNNNGAYVGSKSWDADNQTVTVTFAGNYLPIGNATIYVNAGTSPNVLKDGWSNAFTSTSFTANIVADTVKPVVEKVEVIDATHIDVTFSETVSGANTVANYSLKDSTDTTVSISSAALQTGNTYRLTTATLNGGSYKLTVKDVVDTSVAANEMNDYTTTLSVNDLIRPAVTATGVFSTDLKKVVINFSEQMATTGVYSVLDKANYQVNFNGSWVDLSTVTGATVSLNNGGKGVTITFPAAQALTAGDQVRVARVADLAGNVTAAFTTDVTLAADDVVLANISNVKAIATNKVQFEVNTTLSAIDVSKFNIEVGGSNKVATAATYVNDSNKSIVTVTVADADKFSTDLTSSPVLNNVEFAAGGLTTTLGTSNSGTVTVTAIDDYVAPAISTVTTKDTDNDGKLDAMVVTFSEALYVASVQESDFTVEGYEVTGISTATNVVTVSVKELSGFDTNATPKVTLVGAVSDNSAQRNSLGAQAAKTSTDNAGPALVGIAYSGTTITLTFSENVTDSTLANGDFTVAGTAITGETATFATGATANDNVVVLTLSADPTPATGETITVKLSGAGVVSDAAATPVVSTQTSVVTYTK